MAMPKRHPTAEEKADLARLTTHDMARKYQASAETVRRWRDELGIPSPAIPGQTAAPGQSTQYVAGRSGVARETDAAEAEPSSEAPSNIWRIPQHVEFENGMWTALEAVQQEMAALETERFEVEIDLPGDRPVLVTWLADLHLGHVGTDMGKLRADLETIKNTEGMYCLLGGDLTDNVVTDKSNRGMLHEQLTPIRIQKHLIDEAVKFLGADRVLAMVLGNHDAWSIASDDYDPIAYLAHKLGCPYLGPFGFITVRLGRQTYRILAAHQFRMRSSFNATHQAKRLEDFQGDADVVFTGHTHESSLESTSRRHQDKVYGQAGSYLKSSRYSKSLGFGQVTMQMPGVILWPDRHKAFGIRDSIIDGPPILRAFRAGEAA